MPQAQAKHVPCAAPLDEATRVELLEAGAGLRAAQNVRQPKRGALEKRLGFKSIASTRLGASARSSGSKVASYRGAPVVIDTAATIDVYSSGLSTNLNRGAVCECWSDDIPLPRGRDQSVVQDIAIANGVVMTAYRNYGEVAIADADTGSAISSPSITNVVTGTTYRIRLAAFSSRYIAVFYHETATGNIDLKVYDTTTNTFGASVSVAVGATVDVFSVASVSDRAIVAYGSGANFVLKTYDQSGLIASQTVGVGAPNPSHIAVDVVGTTAWVAIMQGTFLCAGSFNTTTLASIASFTPALITATVGARRIDVVSKTDTTKARVYLFDTTTTNGTELVFLSLKTTAGAAAADGSTVTVHGAMPDSRMFRQGSNIYVAVHGSPEDSSFFGSGVRQRVLSVVDCTSNGQTLRPIAHIDPGLVHFNEATSKWVTDASGRQCFAYGVIVRSVAATDFGTTVDVAAVKMARLDFSSPLRWQAVEHNDALHIVGGMLSVFDGDIACEAGFCAAPVKPALTSAGGSIAAGTYNYVVIFEDVESDSKIAYSGVSAPNTIVTGVASNITVKVPPLTVTQRASRQGLRAAIYRTVAGGAAPYYRVGSVQNDPTVGLLSYVDSTTDAVLVTHAKLYAPSLPGVAGESLDRRAPVGAQCITTCNGVLVYSRGSSVYCSGQQVYGEATWFSPLFEQPIPGAGRIIALAAQDGAVYVFRESEIYALSVEPPSDNGTAGGLGTPRRLAVDVGCVDPRSVVVTSLGIFFQSRYGISILTRAQAVEAIGDPIKPEIDTWPTVTAAVLDDENGLVRFSLTDGLGSEGVDVVFDLQLKYWVSTDTKYGSAASQLTQDACMIKVGGIARYAWLASDGTVYIEKTTADTAPWLDNGTFVTSSFTTGQWHFGPQQEQRIYNFEVLFERYSAAGLSVFSQSNYGFGGTKTMSWTEAETASKNELAFRPDLRCSSVILTISDSAPSVLGTGQGFCFVALSADMAPVQGYERGTPRIAGLK